MPPGMAAAFSARAGGQGGGRNNRNSTSRSGTAAPLSAVADPRTQSVIVTASKDMMFQVAEIVAQLDASTARKQKVFVYTLENADVLQVESVLRDLFQINGSPQFLVQPVGSPDQSRRQQQSADRRQLHEQLLRRPPLSRPRPVPPFRPPS
jgi:hypothetical protein